MSNVTGAVTLTANEQDYTLWLGFSVLAELQAKHGQDVLERLDPPEGADENWMPDLAIIRDLMLGALQRYHSDQADRWLVDDILAQNNDALGSVLAGAFPDNQPEGKKGAKSGNGKRPKQVA